MTVVAFSFSIVAAASCKFYEFTGYLNNRSGQVGLFQLTDPETGECADYRVSSAVLQPVVVGARACAILAIIFGALSLLLVLVEFCCCKIPCGRLLINIVYFIAWVCQGLTFLVWANQTYW